MKTLDKLHILNEDKINQIKKLFATLSDDERLEIIRNYCKYCGCKDNRCQCWNND
jgi:DNA-binding transcriptional ArsR family regulator